MVYTAVPLEAVDAEFRRILASARLVSRPRELASIRVDLTRVLDLRSPSTMASLGIRAEDVLGDDVAIPQAIGEAAQHLGYEAIVAPSATGMGHIVAVFLTDRAPESTVEVIETRSYDPAE